MGDNSDPYPLDPDNIPPSCGTATINYGQLNPDVAECIAGGSNSFYVWIANNNTNLTVTTQGGSGDVDIHFNADIWASATNAQASSTNQGNAESFTVVTNRGWRYIAATTTSSFSGVSITENMN